MAQPTSAVTCSQRDIPTSQEHELVDQFQLLQAEGGRNDILIAGCLEGGKRGVWILEDSKWFKHCDVPKDIPMDGVSICTVADGLTMMGGETNDEQTSPLCYHYSLSEKRWRKLPDMIIPRYARAAEIRPKVVMVLGGNKCVILDIKQAKWFSTKPYAGFYNKTLVAAANGRVFILGLRVGDSDSELLEYHPATNSCTTMQMDIPKELFLLHEMAVVADKLYLFGEVNMEYDITTGHVTQLPDPNSISSHNAKYRSCVRRKKVLLCAGSYVNDSLADVIEEYNPETQQWKVLDISLPFSFNRGGSFVGTISV